MENITERELQSLKCADSEREWERACQAIKNGRNGRFPPDWWARVMASGLAKETADKWLPTRRQASATK